MAVLLGLLVLARAGQANAQLAPTIEYHFTNGEFNVFGKAVVDLLKTRVTTNFAAGFSPSSGDWQSVITTNLSSDLAERIEMYAKGSDRNTKRLNSDAQAMLDRADSLHLNFSDSVLNYQVMAPIHNGMVYLSEQGANPLVLPYVDKLEIRVTRASQTTPPDEGDFKVLIQGLEKFPTGWRISEGIQWTAFPANVADARTLQELSMLNKIATYQPITTNDDPALLKLGQSLVNFIRHPDPATYENDFLMNSDTIWAIYQKSGRTGPSREEVNQEIETQNREQVAIANKMIKLMSDNGIDLTNAEIHILDAGLGHCQSQGPPGTLDQLVGSDFLLNLSVQTPARGVNGASLSGEYGLGAQEIMKLGGDWKVAQDIHWEKLPDGVVDSNTAANIELENYVAKYGALPAGSSAPEIHFTSLDGNKDMKLSDLRGKVVVLDFWATWCGPCQEPMADLQTLRQEHPDWKDRVAIVPVSIDDTAEIVRKHVNQHGWTNTFNVWAGEGGWHSATAQTFRVTGVPTSYVLDPQGKIVWSGHPFRDNVANEVDGALDK